MYINGQELTAAQVMSLRVALNIGIEDITAPDSCGLDEHGQTLRLNYLAHMRYVQHMLLNL